MSRIRSVKPDFWSSAQVMSVSMQARLVFIGVWNFSDDAGRFRWQAATLRAQILPGDVWVDASQMEEWLSELAYAGLVQPYVNGGKAYGRVTGWHHQKISKPNGSKYPTPPPPSHTLPEHSGSNPGLSGFIRVPPGSSATDPLGSTPLHKELEAALPLVPPALVAAPVNSQADRRRREPAERTVGRESDGINPIDGQPWTQSGETLQVDPDHQPFVSDHRQRAAERNQREVDNFDAVLGKRAF